MCSVLRDVSPISRENYVVFVASKAHHLGYMTRRVLSQLYISAAICLLPTGVCLGQSPAPQQNEQQQKIPVATQWTLEAAGPVQKTEINAVMLLLCSQSGMKGTGFLIDKGLVVTNNHVVSGCGPEQMIGYSSAGRVIHFAKMATDGDVDLALLKPLQPLTGGLHLSTVDRPSVGTSVSTWGYPLQFNGPAPLLSNGYIAGFIEDGAGARKVKHLVVDGAINPGNSGGPLFKEGDDKVIGIVVAKFLPFSPSVQQIISVMSKTPSGLIYNGTDGTGQPVRMSEAQVVATVLQEFYNGTQVMIGEAISVTELKILLAAKEAELQ
jgi:S1-C subfamily serine protease